MTMRVFGSKFKARPADPPAQPPPGNQGPPGVDPAALAAAQRDAQIAQAAKAQADREVAELRRKVQEADAERDRATVRNAIVQAAATAKALNPDHVVGLKGSDFIIHSGKVVSKADPTKDVGAVLGEFFAGEGKYLLAPGMPSSGSGAPGVPGTPPAAAPADLTTKEGLTRVTRGLTFGLFNEKPAQGNPSNNAPAPNAPPKQGA